MLHEMAQKFEFTVHENILDVNIEFTLIWIHRSSTQ